MLTLNGLPTWMQVGRLVLTFSVTVACGIHAYGMFKTHLLLARRWMYYLYSIAFLLTSIGMFGYLMIAVRMGDYSRGPYSFGLFSILLIMSYLALTYGVSKRDYNMQIRDYNTQNNGQEPII